MAKKDIKMGFGVCLVANVYFRVGNVIAVMVASTRGHLWFFDEKASSTGTI